ncbi:MAG TPA: nucleotidyltransferase domain-containing protein [Anaerolineae bacterium]|nr:nucleotidyltransferase domain-containing protein [Anaerolineae bacterium]
MIASHPGHLNDTERKALVEFTRLIQEQLDGVLLSVHLFGSKARGEGTPESDIDVLIVVKDASWKIRKQILHLAADICLEYDLNLSPRVWSLSHFHEMQELQSPLYQNIQRDSIELLASRFTTDSDPLS